ncbi:MAG: diguanylate cyclase [Marinobacter sp.]|nr:diguanylate cyclase [Marinobacter sp.]
MDKLNGRRTPMRRALLVVLAYLVAGILWITFSDTLTAIWFTDLDTFSKAQTYKGWLFVGVTALVLFVALTRQLARDRVQLNLQFHQREEIHRLSQFQKTVIDNANIWINVLDTQARVVLWNKAAETISGYTQDEVAGSDDIWSWLYPDPSYRERITATVRAILEEDESVEDYETRIRTRDGGERLISWTSRRLFDDQTGLIGSIAIGIDVTHQRATEAALRQRERQLVTLMENLPGMAYRCLYDDSWTLTFVSNGCESLLGYEPEALLGNRDVAFVELIDEGSRARVERVIEEAIAAAESFSVEYPLTRRDGETVWVWESGRSVEEDGQLIREGVILDITDRKELERELSNLATHDPLTGLFNRRETQRVLQEEIERAARYNRNLALLWIDLDHFKTVNDRYGHSSGDKALVTVCKRLAASIRQVDTFGRYGGEEFVLLLPEMGAKEAFETAERLRKLMADEPIMLDESTPLNLTLSIGISVFPHDGSTADDLCGAADTAMYAAKRAGRNQVCLASDQVMGESL